ncbi:MAG: tRNA (guanosine(37)-N1)-methyltransferase TrmD [Patescibacteria group bacterium]
MITFHIITLFPEAFESYLKSSILGRAVDKGLVKIKFYHPRKFAADKHKMVDDRPYAGGAGMVMKAEPVMKAAEKIFKKIGKAKTKVILLEVAGRQFNNASAIEWSKFEHLVLISGRYEGMDARISKMIRTFCRARKNISVSEISVGPYIVMGGELPALIIIDAVSRHLKGVLGKEQSLEEVRFKEIAKKLGKSIASAKAKTPSLPVYTRPEIIVYRSREYKVPKVLTTGNHKKINEWKAKNMKFIQ